MNDFLFRASIAASTDNDAQNFGVLRTNMTLIYQSNYNFLAAALAAMSLALFAVLLQLWGWWELGRQVSLSSIEIVRAFGALAVQQPNKTSGVGEILELVGKTEVKYDGKTFNRSAALSQGQDESSCIGSAVDE
jgi:hypothetical protein